MIRGNNVVEWENCRLLDRGNNILTYEDVVKTFVLSALGGHSVMSMLVLNGVGEIVLCDNGIQSMHIVANGFIEVSTQDYLVMVGMEY